MSTLPLSALLILNNKHELLLVHRKDHDWYETAGGKVDPKDCANYPTITQEDLLRTATRELHEELGTSIVLEQPSYFGNVEFDLPDGRHAVAHKFLVKYVSGKALVQEPDLFTHARWISLVQLQTVQLSPDLGILLPQLLRLVT